MSILNTLQHMLSPYIRSLSEQYYFFFSNYETLSKQQIITSDPFFLHHWVISLESVDFLFVGFTFHSKLQATGINPSHLFILLLNWTLNGVQYSSHPFNTQFLCQGQQDINTQCRGENYLNWLSFLLWMLHLFCTLKLWMSCFSVYFYQIRRFYKNRDPTHLVNAMKPSWPVRHTNMEWMFYVLENVPVSIIAIAMVTGALQTSDDWDSDRYDTL